MTDERQRQHTDTDPAPPPPPEPSFAEQARTLLHVARVGALSTLSQRAPGFPFGSVAPYGINAQGQPTFLISSMAMHTQNLVANPHASLLVTHPAWNEDPLAGARVTLVGTAAATAASEVAAVRTDYLARHPTAQHWVDFSDFRFYQLDVIDLYFVAGFGAMGWVEASAYRVATSDPLADSAAGILSHMNADHADALVLYCRAFAGIAAEAATMTAIDRLGFRVRAQVGDRLQGVRLNFPRAAHTPQDARTVLIEMVRDARARLGIPTDQVQGASHKIQG